MQLCIPGCVIMPLNDLEVYDHKIGHEISDMKQHCGLARVQEGKK